MKTLWLENQTLSFREDVPDPDPQAGEALVRVRLAGICGTDLEMTRGYYPFTGVPGHEFVGEVIAAEDADWVGRRVVSEINITCGRCAPCSMGNPTHCERRAVIGIRGQPGVFADLAAIPLANLHPVPDSVPDEAAVFTEPLAAALEIQQQTHIHADDRVLLIGAGRLGQLVAQTLALTGCELTVVERNPKARQLLEARGISVIGPEDVPSRQIDVVVDASGSPQGFALARQAVRPRGTLVIKSTYTGEIQVNFSSIVVDEITIIGSRCGPFAPALRLLESGRVDPTPLIAARYPLADGLTAFAHAKQPGALKILLEMMPLKGVV